VTITSQQRGSSSCHVTRDRPSGLLPSILDRPLDYLVTGMLADTINSVRVRCLAILPDARLLLLLLLLL